MNGGVCFRSKQSRLDVSSFAFVRVGADKRAYTVALLLLNFITARLIITLGTVPVCTIFVANTSVNSSQLWAQTLMNPMSSWDYDMMHQTANPTRPSVRSSFAYMSSLPCKYA